MKLIKEIKSKSGKLHFRRWHLGLLFCSFLFIKLFDVYLKKELGWRHTDDFKKVVNEL